jgi:hypothetical protein
MGAREPKAVALTAALMEEAKRDAPKLADLLFGDDAFTDARNVRRPEYLRYFAHGWVNGLTLPGGTVVGADEWRARALDRLGEERFWKDAHEAFGLSPAAGLAAAKAAAEPPPLEPAPPLPEDT